MDVGSLLTSGVWLIGAVTVVALLRAKPEHVPVVFAAYAAAFGIHHGRNCAKDDPPGDVEAISAEAGSAELAGEDPIAPIEEKEEA
ncbi:hypothetical protein GCM10011591_39890 [Nocardia camponoti]|uniref:Uncharacterized protein n=2 Tax=Nocardia camponoti TaxID=1616106 RepID=A0A917VCT2_9NOCA|nr:hypothetical protein GCM10011591_39890 [Nocardia camponoti]